MELLQNFMIDSINKILFKKLIPFAFQSLFDWVNSEWKKDENKHSLVIVTNFQHCIVIHQKGQNAFHSKSFKSKKFIKDITWPGRCLSPWISILTNIFLLNYFLIYKFILLN